MHRKRKSQAIYSSPVRFRALLAGAAAAFFLAACGNRPNEPRDVSTVVVTKSGSFAVTSVEAFDESLYSSRELSDRVDTELETYNRMNPAEGDKKNVSLVSLQVKGGRAVLLLNYAAASDYASFNDTKAYYGSVLYAKLEGFDLSPLVSCPSQVENDVLLSSAELERLGNNPLLILSEPVSVELPSEILYCTGNAAVTDRKKAVISESVSEQNPAMFILK